MCIFCGQSVHTTAPHISEGQKFKDLRLSLTDYERLKSSSPSYLPSPADRPITGENRPMLKVVAVSADVKEVFKEVKGSDDQDWIELPFSMLDSVLWVMQRLERILRIPMKYWVLTGGGIIYSPGYLVMSLEHFRQAHTIEVTLLPVWDVEEFASMNLKTHTWKHAPPNPPAELPSEPRERANVLFSLIDPIGSPHWNDYITHREAAEKLTQGMMEDMEGEDMALYTSKLKEAVEVALVDEADLKEGEWEKIADGVSLVTVDVQDDGDFEVRDADVIARIHSPNSPQSVDVHFSYHHRTRWSSVEWLYSLGYRINPQPVKCVRAYRDYDVDRAHCSQGWRPFGWFYLDDRDSERSACPITRTDLQRVHDALFGTAEAGKLGERVSLRTTAKLILASVGIPFEIARDQEEAAEGENDGYMGSYGSSISLELKSEKPGISAAHLRKICGINPLPNDGGHIYHFTLKRSLTSKSRLNRYVHEQDTADLTKEQRTTPDEYIEDRDSADDDDDDEDYF
ncbi:hypothetical protein EW146_g8266 [Bondarzewia mesenterica]|uniref:Uncharacterized protein n=1 Tax=Bondarzewia mesenterica TaxID=1095465 RepID=A0A4S4LFZ3_9AGAM|nr:hypothetical protein EW146_g8266 [Bondarzewia mesenterica]